MRLLFALLFAISVAVPSLAAPTPAEAIHQIYICHLQLEEDDEGSLIEAKYRVLKVSAKSWNGHDDHEVEIGGQTFTDVNLGPVGDFETRPRASEACPELPDIEAA